MDPVLGKDYQTCKKCQQTLDEDLEKYQTVVDGIVDPEEAHAVRLLEVTTGLKMPLLEESKLFDLTQPTVGVGVNDENIIGIRLDKLTLEHFPPELFYLHSLEVLSMPGAKLKRLPRKIHRLTNLRFLNLRKNPLEFLPEELSQLKKLEHLDLRETSLYLVPDSIGGLTNLKWLDLSNNLLYSLPDSFSNLKRLEWLNLFQNQLKYIPSAVGDLQIERLGVGGNPLNTDSQEAVKSLAENGCTIVWKQARWNQIEGKKKRH